MFVADTKYIHMIWSKVYPIWLPSCFADDAIQSWSSTRAWCVVSILISGIGSVSAQSEQRPLTARDIFLRTTPAATTAAQTVAVEGFDQLGIRYTMFLADEDGRPVAVNSKRNFRNGDCFALEVESNLSGYLYVFAEGASGRWKTLYPSTPRPGTQSVIPARRPIRLPVEQCWEFGPPAGDERLFVFLSKEASEASKLIDLFRLSDLAKTSGTTESADAPPPTLVEVRTRLGSRNLIYEPDANTPPAPAERPYSVYAVAPHPRLFFEITMRHR